MEEIKQGDLEDMKIVAASNELFSIAMYNLLKDEKGNVIISPLSLSMAMAMLSVGAEGQTFQQINEGFFFPSPAILQAGYQSILELQRSSDYFTLEMANNIFAQKDYMVMSEFKQIMKRSFRAEMQMVDFEGDTKGAAKVIDLWMSQQTRNRINTISEDILNSSTKMVLLNTMFFHGEWKEKFETERTKQKDFFVNLKKAVKVPMMIQRDEFLWSSMESLDSTMVELPYNTTGCHNIVMQILLPDDKDGLDEVEEKLGKTSLQEVFEKTCRETDVEIQLPKFKLEKTITLNKLLASLGMTDMFNDEADFTGITDKKGLFVSLVLQKNLIDVDEDGSVTATVTAVEMEKCRPSPPAKQFTVDHPFIFYLRDKTTKMLLFMGRVTNPLQEA